MKHFIDRLSVAVSICLIVALLCINTIFAVAGCPNFTTGMRLVPKPCRNITMDIVQVIRRFVRLGAS
jgi:hypothetical protein